MRWAAHVQRTQNKRADSLANVAMHNRRSEWQADTAMLRDFCRGTDLQLLVKFDGGCRQEDLSGRGPAGAGVSLLGKGPDGAPVELWWASIYLGISDSTSAESEAALLALEALLHLLAGLRQGARPTCARADTETD